jgi:hypothetical protein
MLKSYLLLLSTTIFTACNTNKTTVADAETDSAKPAENTIMIPNTQCYASINGKDTVFLKMEKYPNVVTGTLIYKLYEKDANKGDIDGKLSGDTLIADYRFISEGKESIRQVAFLIKDSTATEGYTDMEELNGKMVFKNISHIDFSTGIKLKQIDCPLE